MTTEKAYILNDSPTRNIWHTLGEVVAAEWHDGSYCLRIKPIPEHEEWLLPLYKNRVVFFNEEKLAYYKGIVQGAIKMHLSSILEEKKDIFIDYLAALEKEIQRPAKLQFPCNRCGKQEAVSEPIQGFNSVCEECYTWLESVYGE